MPEFLFMKALYEAGELGKDAAERELLEETGYRITAIL